METDIVVIAAVAIYGYNIEIYPFMVCAIVNLILGQWEVLSL